MEEFGRHFIAKFEGEVKKTFALRLDPQAPAAPGGLGRNAKVFLTSSVLWKNNKKKPIFDHFEPSVKQISPFSFTLHMSISVYTPYKNLKSN